MKTAYTFQTLYDHVKAQKSDFWKTNIYGLAATLLLLPVPMLLPILIDEVLLDHPGWLSETIKQYTGYSEVWVMIVWVLFTVLFLRIGAYVSTNRKTYYATKLTQKISFLLRKHILDHLERVSLAEYETLKSGGIATKTIQDVEQVSGFASRAVTTALSATLMLFGIAVVMLWMNWMLALIVFLLNPLFLAFSRLLGRKTRKLMKQKQEAYQLYQELLQETLELFIQVRASHQEKHFFSLLKERAKGIEETASQYGYKAAQVQQTSSLLMTTTVDLFRALGVAAVAYSDLTVGMMIAFLFYLSTMTQPLQQLMGLVIAYQTTKPALERINTLLALEIEPQYTQERDPFLGKGTVSVRIEDLSFSYAKGKEVLHHISLEAKEGEKIALIGPSGSGKTTLAQLLVGFYHSHTGTILYGDVPLERIGLDIVRKNVALMLQQSLFFNDTLRKNLTLSSVKSDEEIYRALAMAKLDSFVKSLEDGLETRIGKNGIRLSGGQRQRLAIARVILANPKVVIFDEATSSLDNQTEFDLYGTLTPFLKGKTTIIIAHRTTTIKQADRIYIVDKGTILAEGNYVSLKEKGLIKEDFDA